MRKERHECKAIQLPVGERGAAETVMARAVVRTTRNRDRCILVWCSGSKDEGDLPIDDVF